jgi:hypothetical protein
VIRRTSGEYRKSDVYLASQPAAGIGERYSIRYLTGLDDSGKPRWSDHETDAAPLFHQPVVGELSVSYNRFLEKWIMLYNCDSGRETPRGIHMRTADKPWGLWSESQILFDPFRDNAYGRYMHALKMEGKPDGKVDNVNDLMKPNVWGGEYGPYQFEDLATGDSGTTTIYFTMSTWNPYTVVLMKATLGLSDPAPGKL